MRCEESLKFKPFLADRGDYIYLQKSWCKGGRDREIPIYTKEQTQLLDEIKQFTGKRHLSLIPEHKTYKQHLNVYQKQLLKAGIYHAHGLSHGFAQRVFKKITGFDCPAKGGPIKKELNDEQRRLDKKARAIVSKLLGHERLSVTSVYLS